MFAGYLVILQLAVIDAVCVWCMANDVVLVPLIALVARQAPGARRPRRLGHRDLAEDARLDAVEDLRQGVARRGDAVLRRPITACAGSGSRAISTATASASSSVPHG